jgi:L-type amino acid transporter 5
MGETQSDKIQLKKTLGVFGGISVLVGVIVGSGIFVSPRGVVREAGSVGASLLIWMLCGLLSIFGAQAYSELGCMIPKAGGDYEYIMAAFGGCSGFLFVWSQLVLIIPTANAIAALTFADYILQPIYTTCSPPYASRLLIGACAVCEFIFINLLSIVSKYI